MPKVKGQIVACTNGYHLVTLTGLLEWLGPTLYEAEGRGDSHSDDGQKTAYREARLLRKVEAWNNRSARLFAADCAARALNTWRARYQAGKSRTDVDPRSTAAVVAARQFARGEITAAALAAAWAAAWRAARAAATDAAWDTERKWQAERLGLYLAGQEPELVKLPGEE